MKTLASLRIRGAVQLDSRPDGERNAIREVF